MAAAEYILTDEMEIIVEAVRVALGFQVLNYQYGYIEELNETLAQWELDSAKFEKKFPLVWVAEPFETTYGDGSDGVNDASIFIMTNSSKTIKAKERMAVNFRPVLYPIYWELKNQICLSPVFNVIDPKKLKHKTAKRFYFGENGKSVLNDVVDCLRVSGLSIPMSNKEECTPDYFTNFKI